jgi:soluble lytic murein transglycosylase-like protein
VLIPPALANPPAPPTFPDLTPPPAIEGLIGMPRGQTSGRRAHLALVRREAERRGLPPDVADAVAEVESAYNPRAVGDVGEIGLMQVRPETAHLLGHRGSVQALFEPETNVRLGVTYLSRAWELAKGDLCRALMKYRAGHGEEQMTALSVEYCRRARNHLASIGSPLARAPLPAAFAEDGAPRAAREGRANALRGTSRLARETRSKQIWAALKTCAEETPVAVAPARGPSRMAREMRSRQIWAHEARAEEMPLAVSPPRGTSRMARGTWSRQIWAEHEARMLAIRERLLPDRPLLPACN